MPETHQDYRTAYIRLDATRLKQEVQNIRDNHKKENINEDLQRMAAVLAVMQEKGITTPAADNASTAPRRSTVLTGNASGGGYDTAGSRARTDYRTNVNQRSSQSYNSSATAGGGVNWGKVVLGAVIMMVGIGLTVSSIGAIFYGAILVGFFMMIGGFMGN